MKTKKIKALYSLVDGPPSSKSCLFDLYTTLARAKKAAIERSRSFESPTTIVKIVPVGHFQVPVPIKPVWKEAKK